MVVLRERIVWPCFHVDNPMGRCWRCSRVRVQYGGKPSILRLHLSLRFAACIRHMLLPARSRSVGTRNITVKQRSCNMATTAEISMPIPTLVRYQPSSTSSSTPASCAACVETQFSSICCDEAGAAPPLALVLLTPFRLTTKHSMRP